MFNRKYDKEKELKIVEENVKLELDKVKVLTQKKDF